MKKILCILLSVLIFAGLFSGCSREKEPLRICVDLDYVAWNQYHAADAMNIFLSRVKDLGGPADIVLDVMPESGVERDTAITRLRTEIMAGEGPDLFIMACDDGSGWKAEALFPIPEKAMENGLFLSLDPYIEDAQFAEWDKLLPQVMAAGRDVYGQQIVPIAYSIPLTFYLESDVPEKPGVETTWQEMLEDKTDMLTAAASWYHTKALALESEQDDHIEYVLGQLADYENEELLFTEKELLQRVQEILELKKQWTPDMPPEVPVHYQTRVGISYDGFGTYSQTYADNTDPFNGIRPEDPKTMIPIYSDDGGTTVTITHFAAISSNTRRPEDAFFILDVLMGLDSQQYSDLYGNWFLMRNSLPMHTDLLSAEYPTKHMGTWYFAGDNFKEFYRVRDQITHVSFSGALHVMLKEMFWMINLAEWGESSQTTEEIVSEYYRKMEQVLKE